MCIKYYITVSEETTKHLGDLDVQRRTILKYSLKK
jgi:hypothetical protein